MVRNQFENTACTSGHSSVSGQFVWYRTARSECRFWRSVGIGSTHSSWTPRPRRAPRSARLPGPRAIWQNGDESSACAGKSGEEYADVVVGADGYALNCCRPKLRAGDVRGPDRAHVRLLLPLGGPEPRTRLEIFSLPGRMGAGVSDRRWTDVRVRVLAVRAVPEHSIECRGRVHGRRRSVGRAWPARASGTTSRAVSRHVGAADVPAQALRPGLGAGGQHRLPGSIPSRGRASPTPFVTPSFWLPHCAVSTSCPTTSAFATKRCCRCTASPPNARSLAPPCARDAAAASALLAAATRRRRIRFVGLTAGDSRPSPTSSRADTAAQIRPRQPDSRPWTPLGCRL